MKTKPKPYEITPVEHEDASDVERQRDSYRAALMAVVVIIVIGGGIMWLYKVM